VQLIRIMQEALANVRKHAHASAAKVVFTFNACWIQVRIEDDGVGFDAARLFQAQGQRFGLLSMRDRAEAVGGTFQIFSAPGCGTQVIVEVPCKSAGDVLRWTEQRAFDCDRPVPSD
jgi:signal transduction histidine kinase